MSSSKQRSAEFIPTKKQMEQAFEDAISYSEDKKCMEDEKRENVLLENISKNIVREEIIKCQADYQQTLESFRETLVEQNPDALDFFDKQIRLIELNQIPDDKKELTDLVLCEDIEKRKSKQQEYNRWVEGIKHRFPLLIDNQYSFYTQRGHLFHKLNYLQKRGVIPKKLVNDYTTSVRKLNNCLSYRDRVYQYFDRLKGGVPFAIVSYFSFYANCNLNPKEMGLFAIGGTIAALASMFCLSGAFHENRLECYANYLPKHIKKKCENLYSVLEETLSSAEILAYQLEQDLVSIPRKYSRDYKEIKKVKSDAPYIIKDIIEKNFKKLKQILLAKPPKKMLLPNYLK